MRLFLHLCVVFLLLVPLRSTSQPSQPLRSASRGHAGRIKRPQVARGLPSLAASSRGSAVVEGGRRTSEGRLTQPPASTRSTLQTLAQGADPRARAPQPSHAPRTFSQPSASAKGPQIPAQAAGQHPGRAPSRCRPVEGPRPLPYLRSPSPDAEASPVEGSGSSWRSSTPPLPHIPPHLLASASSSSSSTFRSSTSSSAPKGAAKVDGMFSERMTCDSFLKPRGPRTLMGTLRASEVPESPTEERKRTPTPPLAPLQLKSRPKLQPQTGGWVSPSSSSPSKILILEGDTRVRGKSLKDGEGEGGRRVGIDPEVEVHESLHGPRSPPRFLGKAPPWRRGTKDLHYEDEEKPFYDSSLQNTLSFMRPGKFESPKHNARAMTHSYKEEESISALYPYVNREDPESPRVKGESSSYYAGSPIFSFEAESYVLTGFEFRGQSYLFGSKPPSGFIRTITELDQGLFPGFKNEYAVHDPRRALVGRYREAELKRNPLFALGRVPLVSHVALRIKEMKSELAKPKKKVRGIQDSSEHFGWAEEGRTAKFYVDQISALPIPPLHEERVQGETDGYKKEVEAFGALMLAFFRALQQNRDLLCSLSSAFRRNLDSFKKSVQNTLARRLQLLSPPQYFKIFEKDMEVLSEAALEEYDSPRHMYTALVRTESAPYLLDIASFLGMHTDNGDPERAGFLTIDVLLKFLGSSSQALPPTRFFHNPLHQIEDPDEMHGETNPRELHFQASKAGSEGAFDPLIRFFGHRRGPFRREEAGAVLVEFLSALASEYTRKGEKEMNKYLFKARELLLRGRKVELMRLEVEEEE